MNFYREEVPFPAKMLISFSKLFEKLEEMARDKDKNIADYASGLLELVEPYPELREGFSDLRLIKKYKKPIDKLSRVLFPEILLTNEIKALTPPFFFKPIYTSTRFTKIIKASGEEFSLLPKDISADEFYLYCCYFILGSYFKFPVHAGGALNVEFLNKDQGIVRTYKMGINADMVEFIPTEKAVDITREDFEELVDNRGDMEIWKKKFPPDSWIMKGICIVNLMDTTVDQSYASITSNLLIKSPDTFQNIRNGLRNLFNNPNLEIGVLTMDKDHVSTVNKNDMDSILLGRQGRLCCSDNMCDYSYDQLLDRKEPLVIPDIDRFHKKSQSPLSEILASINFKSYIIAPLIFEDELQGFLELASEKPYELNSISLGRLDEILPVLAMAHKRFKTEEQNYIEAIIQQECTTVHPSVKWRFEEEARKFMTQQESGDNPMFKDIVFNSLFPLYGQVDIKGSSTTRNEAVKKDLLKQIKGVKKVLKYAFEQTKMHVYEELIYRVDTYREEIKRGMSAGSEHKILGFLRSEIYPVFDHMKKTDKSLEKMVKKYDEMLDPDLETVYEERKDYDYSVNMINQKLASCLDEGQPEAQEIFPHYFERYKTDGVEFNMYIGQSISREKEFNLIYLQNLRLWQLLQVCKMEYRFKELQNELPVSLEVTSLILVYSTPLSVHFRMDEKRFDVEGAYNARYEIIKKRIDKAYIKGTRDRITQPGHIAIIYSQEQDAREYHRYLDFLIAKGYIKKGYEDVELEDLQGISGLRALRAKISYGDKKKQDISVNKLLETIRQGSEN